MAAAKKNAVGKAVKTAGDANPSAAIEIDQRIEMLADWRGHTLRAIREHIHAADPGVIEEVKWRKPSNPLGVPVWSHDGILCTSEVYKDKVKLTFAYGASLDDPTGLFNASLDGGTRRAIDLHEGRTLDSRAFRALIRAAVERNAGSSPKSRKKSS